MEITPTETASVLPVADKTIRRLHGERQEVIGMRRLWQGLLAHRLGVALLGAATLGIWWVFPDLGFAAVLALVAGVLAVWWRGPSDALQGLLVGLVAGLLVMEAGFVSFVAKEAVATALGLSLSPASFGYSWPQTLVAGLSIAANLGRLGMLCGAAGGVLSAILAVGIRRITSFARQAGR